MPKEATTGRLRQHRRNGHRDCCPQGYCRPQGHSWASIPARSDGQSRPDECCVEVPHWWDGRASLLLGAARINTLHGARNERGLRKAGRVLGGHRVRVHVPVRTVKSVRNRLSWPERSTAVNGRQRRSGGRLRRVDPACRAVCRRASIALIKKWLIYGMLQAFSRRGGDLSVRMENHSRMTFRSNWKNSAKLSEMRTPRPMIARDRLGRLIHGQCHTDRT